MVTRDGNESLQRPLLKRLTSPSSGVLPSRQSIECGTILAHLLRRCTRLLMVLPSRQQSAMCSIMSCEDRSSRHQYAASAPGSRALYEASYLVRIGCHITSIPHALWCLEGTTLSNRGQRPRLYGPPPSLCLEGSTPEDGKVYSCLSPWRGW